MKQAVKRSLLLWLCAAMLLTGPALCAPVPGAATGMPGTGAGPVATAAPRATEMPVGAIAPAATEMPVGTIVLTATEMPVGTIVPAATETPVGTIVPTATEIPVGTIVLIATEMLVATETPVETIVPAATEMPVGTIAPAATEMPVATKSPAVSSVVEPGISGNCDAFTGRVLTDGMAWARNLTETARGEADAAVKRLAECAESLGERVSAGLTAAEENWSAFSAALDHRVRTGLGVLLERLKP